MNFGQLVKFENPDEYVHLKRWHIAAAGGHTEGIVLAHIFGWFVPNRRGGTKLTINRDGRMWMACSYNGWHERLLIPERTMRRVLSRLENSGLIVTAKYMFKGSETIHVSLVEERVVELYVAYQSENTPEKKILPEKDLPGHPAKVAGDHGQNGLHTPAKVADSFMASTTDITTTSLQQQTTPAAKPPRLSESGLKNLYGSEKYAEAVKIATGRGQKADNYAYIAGILQNQAAKAAKPADTGNKYRLSPEQIAEKLGVSAPVRWHYYDGQAHYLIGPEQYKSEAEKAGFRYIPETAA